MAPSATGVLLVYAHATMSYDRLKYFENKKSKCSYYPYSPHVQGFLQVIYLTQSTTPNIWVASCKFTTEILHKL